VPNPFNPTTVIQYDVPETGAQVTLMIYDVAGRMVRTLVDGWKDAGTKHVTWNGDDDSGGRVASGVYFYRMTALGFEMTKKMVLLQ
jgi:flagellar hook assembly protein FlgD